MSLTKYNPVSFGSLIAVLVLLAAPQAIVAVPFTFKDIPLP